MDKPYLYIYSDNYQDYLNFAAEYEKTNTCMWISDQYYLQNRTPGEIIDISKTGERWDHDLIQSHIERYREDPAWKPLNSDEDLINEVDYGIDN